MNNDTSAPKKPLSKRDKVLGYGCLLPLMVCGALAFLSNLFKGNEEAKDEIQAMLANNIEDSSSQPFTAKDAQYIVDAAGNLFNEAQDIADESFISAGLSKPLSDRLRHLKVKQRALLADIISSGYDPRLRSVGTVRDELYLALSCMGQICKFSEEMAMSKTDDSRRLSGDVARSEIKAALEHLGKAHAMLGMMEGDSQNSML